MLSTSSIVETDGATVSEIDSVLLVNAGETMDLRPRIGSNLSSIESRGLFGSELQPRDSKKSKSFELRITEKI